MSDVDLLRFLRHIEHRIGQTEVKEVPLYQTGTYAPTYTGSVTLGTTTYTAQVGYYTRIGRMVHVVGFVAWTAATGTGNARINIPLVSANLTNAYVPLVISPSNVTYANSAPNGLIYPNSFFFEMYSPISNGAQTVVAVEAAGDVRFTAIYITE